MEKNRKNKNKQDTFENVLPRISTREALQNMIETDSQRYIAGLQLSFLAN
jgi:hypothetical protein